MTFFESSSRFILLLAHDLIARVIAAAGASGRVWSNFLPQNDMLGRTTFM
jgi:hypothetical protein